MALHRRPTCIIAILGLVVTAACGTPEDQTDTSAGVPLTGIPDTDASAGSTGDGSGSTTGDPGEGTADSSGGGFPKLDVGPAASTGAACPPDDLCCAMELPPHELLDAFLLAYPPANMPKSVAEVQAFMPQADGHMMAWSDENVGGELVDASNGGVIEANIEAGRDLSRMAAELAVPAGAMIVDVRDDPVIIEDLGGGGVCIGVGWAWGSLLFEGLDGSIGELVYLYIGYCADGDVEVFYYSDESVQICEPPG